MDIPNKIQKIIDKIQESGFEACLVGGCVRDLLLAKNPEDWDITTSAIPEEILKIFKDSKYTNRFGTVLVKTEDEEIVEITTYRSDGRYNDNRRPDEIKFEKYIDKDLSRRDFTINALALIKNKGKLMIKIDERYVVNFDDCYLIDGFTGLIDLNNKIIKAVGNPLTRFSEDALRMLRAVRFAVVLGFEIEDETKDAIKKLASNIVEISNERIRDELIKIIKSDNAYDGIIMLSDLNLLKYILPELSTGIGIDQNKHHKYTVFEHNALSLKYCPNENWQVRFAALMHDIGKVKAKKIINDEATFYNHEYIGAKMMENIANRLKFTNKDKKRIVNLVKNHMFYYNVGEVTEASVRRLIKKVGKENLKDLIDVRIADRLGSGVPKAKPYKIRHLEYLMEKVQKDPISVKMLKIDGSDLMEKIKIKPGPKIGAILDILLSEVIQDPKLNNYEYLIQRSEELKEEEFLELRKKAKDVIKDKRKSDDDKTKGKFYVK